MEKLNCPFINRKKRAEEKKAALAKNKERDEDIQQSAQALNLKNIYFPKKIPSITQRSIDINKRNFIKKGILGLIAGIGIAAFSKIARAGGFIHFSDGTSQTTDVMPHASRHQSGGADSIKLDDFATPDDNTDLNVSTTRHGLLKKLDNSSTNFMNGQGNWAAPGAGDVGEGHITILPWNYNSIGQGTWTIFVDASELYNGDFRSSSANNGDNFSIKVYLETGTYTLRVLYTGAGSYGIVDIDINGIEVASYDGYNPPVTYNNVLTQTGISITGGLQDVKVRVDGKNGSSGGYQIRIMQLILWRTA